MVLEKIRWERIAAILICAVLGSVLLFASFRFLLPVMLPFLIAWMLSRIIDPMARGASKRTRIPRRLCAAVLTLLLFGGVAFGLVYFVQRAFLELRHLLEGLLEENGGFYGAVEHALERLEQMTVGWFRFGNGNGGSEKTSAFREQLNRMLTEMVGGFLTSLSAALPSAAGRFLSAFPTVLLVSAVTVIAGLYFSMDGDRIAKSLTARLPSTLRDRLSGWSACLKQFFRRYVRAYLLLLVITLLGLFVGFCILGVDYALLLATITAAVDFLPVLGIGVVLLPWAAVALLQRNIPLGVGLLILYAVMLIVRQIAEPKLVGKSLGIHPLLSLFAGYVGFRFFGLVGMILGPLIAVLVKQALEIREGGKE